MMTRESEPAGRYEPEGAKKKIGGGEGAVAMISKISWKKTKVRNVFN